MSQENLSRKEKIKLLEEFIQRVSNSKELKRGLAVKLALEGYTYNAIKEILVVSIGFISKWKTAFEFGSIKALKLQHKGSTGYLNREEKEETVEWIINQEAWDISELESYLIEKYDVVFKSRQSYYDILKIARLSWQKGEIENPKKDPELVKEKNKEIGDLLEENREDIESGRLVVYIIDECHLLYQDICGQQWNFIKNPIKIQIGDYKERQTYFGAMNLAKGEFILREYKSGNGENTIKFVKELQKINGAAKLLLIWDGASYHRGEEMKNFLGEENEGLKEEEWKVRCQRFAPYAPEENPVEAIWLQLKTLLRRFYPFGKNFKIVKYLFQMFVNLKLFNLPDLKKYDAFSQFI
jgi:transposase